ncbi:MAG: hypothetical protein ACE5R7_08705 [Nitrosarchaeum sp.]
MTNGLEIKNAHDFVEIYRDNEALALGFIAENVIDLKKDVSELNNRCTCRYEECKRENNIRFNGLSKKIKRTKFKDFLMQFPGGMISGAIVSFLIFKFWILTILKKVN